MKRNMSDYNAVYEPAPVAFNLFPNPANNKLEIRMAENEPAWSKIEIYNMIGVLQSLHQPDALSNTISINHLVPGAYVIKVSMGNKQSISRCVRF